MLLSVLLYMRYCFITVSCTYVALWSLAGYRKKPFRAYIGGHTVNAFSASVVPITRYLFSVSAGDFIDQYNHEPRYTYEQRVEGRYHSETHTAVRAHDQERAY